MPKSTRFEPSETISTFTSFTDEQDLLRAASLDAVTRKLGLIFKDSAGSAETYHMSQPVDRIDWFISHNWSTPRSVKFGVLCLKFNMAPALLVVLVMCMTVLIPGQALGVIPSYAAPSWITDEVEEKFAGCLVCGSIAFPMLLLFWCDLRYWISNNTSLCTGPRTCVFLDKVCIHQTDLRLKRKGIQHLAGFVQNSRGMLVVFADTYLVKLWTVYEVASYLALCPKGKLDIVPIFLPQALALSYVWCSLFTVSASAVQAFAKSIGLSTVPITIACHCLSTIPVTVLLRRCSKKKEYVSKQVEDFSLRHAKCFDESDRAIVQHNVAKLMESIGLVNRNSSEDDALDAFDELVRRKVPQFMHRSFAHSGIQYRYATAINISLVLQWFDSIAKKIRQGATMWVVASSGLGYLSIILFWWPLSVEVGYIIVQYRLDARCHHEMLIVAIACLAGGSVYCAGLEGSTLLDTWSRESSIMMVPHLLSFALLGLLTWCCYGGRRRDEMPEATLKSCSVELSALPPV